MDSKICLIFFIPVQVIQVGLAENWLLSGWPYVIQFAVKHVVDDVGVCLVDLDGNANVVISDRERDTIKPLRVRDVSFIGQTNEKGHCGKKLILCRMS